MFRGSGCAAVVISLLACAAPLGATQAIFSFNSYTGDLGLSKTYTDSGVSLTATGFTSVGGVQPVHLYGKTDNYSADQNGLGLANDPSGHHEIAARSFVQLDFTNIRHRTAPQTVSASTTANLGNLILSGADERSHSLYSYLFGPNANSNYLNITAASGNVIISQVDVTGYLFHEVPEPLTLLSMGVGLLLLGRRLKRKGR